MCTWPISMRAAKRPASWVERSWPDFHFKLSNGTGAIGLVVDPAGHPVGLYSVDTWVDTTVRPV